MALEHGAPQRNINHADVVQLLQLDGAFDGVDDVTILAAAIFIEDAKVDEPSARRDTAKRCSEVGSCTFLRVPRDDAGHVGAMAIFIVRVFLVVKEALAVDYARILEVPAGSIEIAGLFVNA